MDLYDARQAILSAALRLAAIQVSPYAESDAHYSDSLEYAEEALHTAILDYMKLN